MLLTEAGDLSRIFLSYSSDERSLAENVNHVLEGEGHTVFFDRDDLPSGETYTGRLRRAVESCDLFVFLVSPASVTKGSYALSELAVVEKLAPRRRPAILPVLAAPTEIETIPSLLRSRTFLEPHGDVAAEIAARAADVRRARRRQAFVRVVVLVGILALSSRVGIGVYERRRAPDRAILGGPAPVAEGERVKLIGYLGVDGWNAVIDIAEPYVREIFSRTARDAEFSSTGFFESRNPATGLPLPRNIIFLPGLWSHHDLQIKYTDVNGSEKGPYSVRLDGQAQFVKQAREQLEPLAWVSILKSPGSPPRASFALLIHYKNALREIRYWVDDESRIRTLHFAPDRSQPGIPKRSEQDEDLVDLSPSASTLHVQLQFLDGYESPPKSVLIR